MCFVSKRQTLRVSGRGGGGNARLEKYSARAFRSSEVTETPASPARGVRCLACVSRYLFFPFPFFPPSSSTERQGKHFAVVNSSPPAAGGCSRRDVYGPVCEAALGFLGGEKYGAPDGRADVCWSPARCPPRESVTFCVATCSCVVRRGLFGVRVCFFFW